MYKFKKIILINILKRIITVIIMRIEISTKVFFFLCYKRYEFEYYSNKKNSNKYLNI